MTDLHDEVGQEHSLQESTESGLKPALVNEPLGKLEKPASIEGNRKFTNASRSVQRIAAIDPARPQQRPKTRLLVRAMDAVDWCPRDHKEWLIAREHWKRSVLASPLSAATKVLAIVVADFYINRNPSHQYFNWAWAAQEKLAVAAGLSRRTVAAAMDDLERNELLVIDRGGGRKGDGGRTHRYTLRMDYQVDLHAQAAKIVQNLHNESPNRVGNILHNSSDGPEQTSCAIDESEMGKQLPKDVNGFPTTPSKITLEDSLYSAHPKEDLKIRGKKRLSMEKRRDSPSIQSFAASTTSQASSIDQTELAKYLGRGDDYAGWEFLMLLPVEEVDVLALKYRYDKTVGPVILQRVHALLAVEAEHGSIP